MGSAQGLDDMILRAQSTPIHYTPPYGYKRVAIDVDLPIEDPSEVREIVEGTAHVTEEGPNEKS